MALANAASMQMEAASGPDSRGEAHWYAAHLRSHHEKAAAAELTRRSVEHFLPLYESLRRWKDRRVTLRLPLFPGYLFVRIQLRDRMQVLEVPGITRLVGFAGAPLALPDAELDALRLKFGGAVLAAPHRYLAAGRRVRVIRGPLEGLEGFFVKRRQKSRIVISIEAIQRSVAVEVEAADVAPVWQAAGPHKVGDPLVPSSGKIQPTSMQV